MGRGAGAEEIQIRVHQWLNNILPVGWDNQIRNDFILTYQIKYEKQITASRNNFLLNGCVDITVGTHTNDLKAGLNFMLGNYISPTNNFFCL